MNVDNFLKLKHQETNSNDKNETERKTCCCGGIVGWVLEQIRKRLDDDRKFLNENWCSVLLLLTYMMAGFLFFRFNEKWGVVDSMYFAVVTFTTVRLLYCFVVNIYFFFSSNSDDLFTIDISFRLVMEILFLPVKLVDCSRLFTQF